MNPLVSIIIPTYSRPKNLTRAINSVLNQTYSPIEIIVVDDNGVGTDFQKETEKTLQSYINNKQILYLKHEVNQNASAARNTGVKAASGKFIGLMDDDDEFLPEKIEKQVRTLEEAFSKDKNCTGCFCNLTLISNRYKNIKIINNQTNNLTENLLLGKVRFNSSTLLLYKHAYESINGFDNRFLRHQDWEFTIRFLSKYKMVLAEPSDVLVKKFKGNNLGNVIAKNPTKYIEIKNFFLREMKPYIDILPQSNEIYRHQWLLLARSLFKTGYIKEGLTYAKRANLYRKLQLSEIFHIICEYFKYFINKMINTIN